MSEINKLNFKDRFLFEDMADYWKSKMDYFYEILKVWGDNGISVQILNGEVVQIYGANELDTEQKHEISTSAEGFLYAEGQYELAMEYNK